MDSGEDLLTAEVPQYIQELIRWEIVGNSLTALALLWAARCSVKKIWSQPESPDFDKDLKHMAVVGVLVIFLSPVSLWPMYNAYTSAKAALKAYVSPRVVLAEKVAELVAPKGSAR